MKHIAHISSLSLSLMLLLVGGYVYVESQRAYAIIDQVTVTLDVTAGISITSPADTSMSTNLGVSSDTAVGTTTWNVKTNNALGYLFSLHASTSPAMQAGANYVEDYATTTNPSTWSVTNAAKFGFSVLGTDVMQRGSNYWGTGSYCNGAATSTVSTTLKYYGFYTTSTSTATRTSTTTTAGVDTTVCYAVEQDTMYIPSGTYTAVISGTAVTL